MKVYKNSVPASPSGAGLWYWKGLRKPIMQVGREVLVIRFPLGVWGFGGRRVVQIR